MDERRLGSSYRLISRIGRGSMGEVWRGEGPSGPVAVKILRPEFADEPDVVHRFIQERTILRSLASEHIVAVRDLVVEGDQLGIVMELVVGFDLRHLLRGEGTLPPSRAIDIAIQVLDGLRVAHAARIVHRDLKPENVLIDDRPAGLVVKIVDFGIARIASGSGLTQVTSVIGTPKYLAPELAAGQPVTPAVDLYSLGIVLYEMLFGGVPFEGPVPAAVIRAHAEDQPRRPRRVPDQLWAVIAILLEKDPARRPDAGTAIDMLRRVRPGIEAMPPFHLPDGDLADEEPTLTGLAAPADTPVTVPRTARDRTRPIRARWPVAAGVVLLAAAVVVGLLALRDDPTDASAACESGIVRAPVTAVQVADDTLVSDGTRYGYVTAGALFPVQPGQETSLTTTGGTRTVSAADFDRIDRRPRNEAVLVEDGLPALSGRVYFSIGGAIFPTTEAALATFRPNAAAPIVVPAGGLGVAPRSPRSGSLLQVDGARKPVWLIRNGSREIVSADRVCPTPDIIRVPRSPSVLAEIPLRSAQVSTTTTAPPSANLVAPPLPDPGVGLVARQCQQQGGSIAAAGTLTNTAYRRLFFIVHVRLLAADGTEVTGRPSDVLNIDSNGVVDWQVLLDPPAGTPPIDRCEYRVEQLGLTAEGTPQSP